MVLRGARSEVMNGCICCTVRGDLAEVLKGSLAKKIANFDGVIIETTGLADPAPVAQTFFVDDGVEALCATGRRGVSKGVVCAPWVSRTASCKWFRPAG